MACWNFDGFEHGVINSTIAIGPYVDQLGTLSNISVVSSPVYGGSQYALRSSCATTTHGNISIGGDYSGNGNGKPNAFGSSLATAYIVLRFRYATKPSSNWENILGLATGAGNPKLRVRIDSSGILALTDSTNSVLGTGSTALAANTWYELRIKCGSHGSTGAYELYINRVLELSGTGNTDATSMGRLQLGKINNNNSNTVDFYYDDVYIDDAEFPDGEITVRRMDVDGNGNYTAWTGTYTDVDEVPPTTTETLTGGGNGTAESYTLESSASAGISYSILSVKPFIVVHEFSTATTAFKIFDRIASTDYTATNNYNGSTSQNSLELLQNTNPNTGVAWTTSDLDSLEVGVQQNGTSIHHRCSAMYVMVAQVSSGYPTITTTNTYSSTGASTHAISMPAGITAGDLLLVYIGCLNDNGDDIVESGGSSWTRLGQNRLSTNYLQGAWFSKVATGGDTLTVDTGSTSGDIAAVSMRITSHGVTTPSTDITLSADYEASGNSSTNDPPYCDPAVVKKHLFIEAGSGYNEVGASDNYWSSNYTGVAILRSNGTGFSSVNAAVAYRKLNDSYDNPGTMTVNDGGYQWGDGRIAFTLAIPPAVTATGHPAARRMGGMMFALGGYQPGNAIRRW